MPSNERDPRKDPRPGDVVGTHGPGGKKAKCTGILNREDGTSDVFVRIAWTKDEFNEDVPEGHRTLESWRNLTKNAEVLHVAGA